MASSNHQNGASPQPVRSLILETNLPASLLDNSDLEEWYSDIDGIGHESHHVCTFFQQFLSHWVETSTMGSIQYAHDMHEVPDELKPDLAMCYGPNKRPPYLLLFLGEESEFPDGEGLTEKLRHMATSYLRSMGQVESEVMIAGIVAVGTRVKFSLWTRQLGSERVEISPSYWGPGDMRVSGSPENWGMSKRILCFEDSFVKWLNMDIETPWLP